MSYLFNQGHLSFNRPDETNLESYFASPGGILTYFVPGPGLTGPSLLFQKIPGQLYSPARKPTTFPLIPFLFLQLHENQANKLRSIYRTLGTLEMVFQSIKIFWGGHAPREHSPRKANLRETLVSG